jgi:hypothetical protein
MNMFPMLHFMRVAFPTLILLVVAAGQLAYSAGTIEPSRVVNTFRPFNNYSYWNRPFPSAAPIDDKSDLYIADANNRDVSTLYLGLTGAPGARQSYAAPLVWSSPEDPQYTIAPSRYGKPLSIRIPIGTQPQTGKDGALWIIDRTAPQGGVFAQLYKARFNGHTWLAASTSQYRIGSNGLNRKTRGSDEPSNDGHRGIPPHIQMVRLDEIKAGAIEHRLACYWHATGRPDTTTPWFYWPMVGYERGKRGITPEGLVIRIKPEVDLSQKPLSPVARIIAIALQRYGCMIGDNSGGKNNRLKLERNEAAWAALDPELSFDALASLPWIDWEFIKGGYDPPSVLP